MSSDVVEFPKRKSEKLTKQDLGQVVAATYNGRLARDAAGQVFVYDGIVWRALSECQARALVAKLDAPEHNTTARNNEALEWAIVHGEMQHGNIKWNSVADDEIPLLDGVWSATTGTLRPHRASDWLDVVIPHHVPGDVGIDGPMDILTQWWGHEPDFSDRVRALAQFMGYCLLAHNKYKRALMCIGPSDTGKSVLLHIMQHLVGGRDFISAVPLRDLGDPRKLAPLRGKRINVLADIGSGEYLDDGGFKSITGGDEIIIDPKYGQPTAYTPSVKFVMAANDAPKVSDRTTATFARLLVMQFTRQFGDDEKDPEIFTRAAENFAPWLLFAMRGAKDLVASRGRWCVPQSSAEFVVEYHEQSNPVYWFFQNRVVVTCVASDFVSTEDLTRTFNDAKLGGKSWGHMAVAGAIRGLNIPGITRCRRMVGGKKVHGWSGLLIVAASGTT